MPAKAWRGVKNADKHDEMCAQWGVISKLTEAELKSRDWEDCLSLCVYSKDVSEN